jgi:hypothetical protein
MAAFSHSAACIWSFNALEIELVTDGREDDEDDDDDEDEDDEDDEDDKVDADADEEGVQCDGPA